MTLSSPLDASGNQLPLTLGFTESHISAQSVSYTVTMSGTWTVTYDYQGIYAACGGSATEPVAATVTSLGPLTTHGGKVTVADATVQSAPWAQVVVTPDVVNRCGPVTVTGISAQSVSQTATVTDSGGSSASVTVTG